MKILHIINSLTTGGAEKLLLDTIPLFNKKGVSVDLLLLDNENHPYLNKLKENNNFNFNIHSLDSRNIYNPFIVIKIIPYLKKYDILHVHLFPSQYWVVFAKLLSFSKTKLVFTEHSTTNKRIESTYFKVLDKLIYNFYDKVICITNEIKNVLIKNYNIDKKKLILVENGIDIRMFNDSVAIQKKNIEKSIKESDKLLIQVAGFRYQKDQKTTIKSLLHLPQNVKLILVGDGEFKKDLVMLVCDLNLSDRVFFLGVRLDVSVLMKSSDIIVVSSHWEGMPLSVIEGMAVRKPVVASNVPGIFQLVNGVGVLFEKGNEKELASKICELLENDNHYNKIAIAGYESAKKHDINIMVDKQILLYKELLN